MQKVNRLNGYLIIFIIKQIYINEQGKSEKTE